MEQKKIRKAEKRKTAAEAAAAQKKNEEEKAAKKATQNEIALLDCNAWRNASTGVRVPGLYEHVYTKPSFDLPSLPRDNVRVVCLLPPYRQ